MTDHLTEEELRGYSKRSLDPVRLLAADDHLSACQECLGRVAGTLEPGLAIPFIRAGLKPRHLEYEQLEASAEGRLLDPEAREHLENCAACREEVDDLRALAVQQRPKTQRRRFWHYGAIAAGIAAALWMTVAIATKPKHPAAPAAPVAAVSKPALPGEYQSLIASAISVGKIEVPARIAALAGRQGQLMGLPGSSVGFHLLGPAGEATLTDRPEFRWGPLPGARSYRVAVFDSNYNQAALSPPITVTSWQVTKPLARGRVYLWQVTASLPGRDVTAPQPPHPETKFTVLPEADASRLEALRAKYPESHLALGVLYGQAGAIDEAATELRQAIATGDNPDAAGKLLKSIKTR